MTNHIRAKIEEAAEKYALKPKATYPLTHVQAGFIDGALSPEAGDYWVAWCVEKLKINDYAIGLADWLKSEFEKEKLRAKTQL